MKHAGTFDYDLMVLVDPIIIFVWPTKLRWTDRLWTPKCCGTQFGCYAYKKDFLEKIICFWGLGKWVHQAKKVFQNGHEKSALNLLLSVLHHMSSRKEYILN